MSGFRYRSSSKEVCQKSEHHCLSQGSDEKKWFSANFIDQCNGEKGKQDVYRPVNHIGEQSVLFGKSCRLPEGGTIIEYHIDPGKLLESSQSYTCPYNRVNFSGNLANQISYTCFPVGVLCRGKIRR